LFHRLYRPLLFETDFVPGPARSGVRARRRESPANDETVAEMERLLSRSPDAYAAVIVEPLVQCAGGIITAPPGQLRRIRELCDRYQVLLIADEVATGFGRTGRMFAC